MKKVLSIMTVGPLEIFAITTEKGVFWRDKRYESIGHGPFQDKLAAFSDYTATMKRRQENKQEAIDDHRNNLIQVDFRAKRRVS